jgi:hypothetical protein
MLSDILAHCIVLVVAHGTVVEHVVAIGGHDDLAGS